MTASKPEPPGNLVRQAFLPISRAGHPKHVPKDSGAALVQADQGRGPYKATAGHKDTYSGLLFPLPLWQKQALRGGLSQNLSHSLPGCPSSPRCLLGSLSGPGWTLAGGSLQG